MSKIAILTFSIASNYGAVLQAYALKKVLRSMGAVVNIVNYRSPQVERHSRVFSIVLKNGLKAMIKSCIKLCFFPFLFYYKSRFAAFQKAYLNDTVPIFPHNIEKLNSQYDIFITGSDQVFNPRGTGRDKNYFLDFVKDRNKCFSYAASFGSIRFDKKDLSFLKDSLKKFSFISVREKQGAIFAKKLAGIKTYVHLDPTLLLRQEQWREIACLPKQKKFILLYLMDRNAKIVQYAEKLAKEKQLELIFLSPVLNLPPNRVSARHIVPTPPEWLGYFLQAEYVVTNSFHGLAFAINFNKKFFVDFLPPARNTNSRLEDLLDLTGLRGRLLDNMGTAYEMPIDWQSVNAILSQEREKAFSYLKYITQSNSIY